MYVCVSRYTQLNGMRKLSFFVILRQPNGETHFGLRNPTTIERSIGIAHLHADVINRTRLVCTAKRHTNRPLMEDPIVYSGKPYRRPAAGRGLCGTVKRSSWVRHTMPMQTQANNVVRETISWSLNGVAVCIRALCYTINNTHGCHPNDAMFRMHLSIDHIARSDSADEYVELDLDREGMASKTDTIPGLQGL